MIKRLIEKYKEIWSKINYSTRKNKLEKAILKNRITVIKVGKKDRATGKTTTLVELAKKYDLPIFVKYYSQVNYLKRAHGFHNVIHASNKHRLRGMRYKTILIEEGFNGADILFLTENFKSVVGFKTK